MFLCKVSASEIVVSKETSTDSFAQTSNEMDSAEEGTDAGIEESLDKIFRLQETIVLQSKAELTLLFKNKMCISLPNISLRCRASQSIFKDGLTRLVRLTGADSHDQQKSYDFLCQLAEQTKTRKRIVIFTSQRFTIQMPSSDEHAIASTEMVRILRKAIRQQMFGLLSDDDPLPMRINIQQEGGRIAFPNMLMGSRENPWPWTTTCHRTRLQNLYGKTKASVPDGRNWCVR